MVSPLKGISTDVEIPFSAETKRVLQYAAEEADRLLHNYIGTEHLLLGILREERSVAASILMEKGMRLHTVREDIVQLLNEKTTLTRVKETPLLAEFSRARSLEQQGRNAMDQRIVDFAASLPRDDRARFGEALARPNLGRGGPGGR